MLSLLLMVAQAAPVPGALLGQWYWTDLYVCALDAAPASGARARLFDGALLGEGALWAGHIRVCSAAPGSVEVMAQSVKVHPLSPRRGVQVCAAIRSMVWAGACFKGAP